MMNQLVFFTSLPKVGGHTTISVELVRLLRPLFSDIQVIVREMPEHGTSTEATDELIKLNARVLYLPGKNATKDLGMLTPFVLARRTRPDVFLSMGMRHFSPVLALMLRPVCSVYYHITHELTPAVVKTLNLYSRFFSKLAFISPATEAEFLKMQSTSKGIVSITQPVGDSPTYASRGELSGPIRFGFIGRLNFDKGCEVLRSFAANCQVPCSLRIAGAGEYGTVFADLATNHQAAAKVRFDGAFDSASREKYLADFFESIDYLVVPSQDDREGIPTVILESLRSGVPVLATRTGGMRAFDIPSFGRPSCVKLFPKETMLSEMTHLASQGRPGATQAADCIGYFKSHFSNDMLLAQWHAVLS
jgi:glycosyltransferase involved in cell wall biosynthesis